MRGDENECRQMLTTGFLHDGPASVRYPRGKGRGEGRKELKTLPIGKADVRHRGSRIASWPGQHGGAGVTCGSTVRRHCGQYALRQTDR